MPTYKNGPRSGLAAFAPEGLDHKERALQMAVQDILRNPPEKSSANLRAERALELYRTHGRNITRLAADLYRVPSSDGTRSYDVLYGEREECACPDFEFHGAPCKHIMAVGISVAKRRTRRATCSGCGDRRPVRELVELTEENHDGLTYFDGDQLCRSCADGAGGEH